MNAVSMLQLYLYYKGKNIQRKNIQHKNIQHKTIETSEKMEQSGIFDADVYGL